MAKQTGPLHLDIERLILAHRYASAVKSGAVGKALRAGAKLVATGSLAASVSPDAEGNQRVAPEALELAAPSEPLAYASLGDAIQSLILDALTAQVLAAPLDARIVEALHAETHAVFGIQPQLELIFDAASQLYAVGPDAARAVMLANGIAIASSTVEREPSRRYHRDMMLIMHVIHSLARAELELGVAKMITAGWASVLEHQRFLLKNLGITAPAIEDCDQQRRSSQPCVGRCLAPRRQRHSYPSFRGGVVRYVGERGRKEFEVNHVALTRLSA